MKGTIMFSKPINFLLDNACIFIKYNIHRDFLKTPTADPVMQAMQNEILNQDSVKKIFAMQNEDGWFGNGLHGGVPAIEGCVFSLLRMGVERENIRLQKARQALATPEISSRNKSYFAGGDALDADERGGNKSIMAAILLALGESEEHPIIKEQIDLSLSHFKGALSHNSVDDFTVKGKQHRYYKPKARFPGANHIGCLARTQSWKTPENVQMVRDSVKHCYALMKDFQESITFRKPKEFGGSFVGPFNFDWNTLTGVDISAFHRIVNDPYKFEFGFWLAKISGLPEWAVQTTQSYETLSELLESDTLMDIIPDKALKGFRHISGIEPSWRNKTAVKCDITYAVLRACQVNEIVKTDSYR